MRRAFGWLWKNDLMKIGLSIGGMSSNVIPRQYVVSPEEAQCINDRLKDIDSAKATVYAELAAARARKSNPQRGEGHGQSN